MWESAVGGGLVGCRFGKKVGIGWGFAGVVVVSRGVSEIAGDGWVVGGCGALVDLMG